MTSTHTKVAGANRAGAAFVALLVTALFLFAGTALAQGPDPDRFIVQFAERGNSDAARQAINKAGASVLLEMPAVNAVAARIPAAALQGLRNNPNIALIEQDSPRYPMAQLTPYGIGMVQADLVNEAANGNVMVCVIDSGFDATHEDLVGANVTGTDVPKSGGGTNYWNTDTCGHGTHVAGTVMAQDNLIGVIGVTPGVDLHVIKVFDGADCGWTYASSTVNAAYACKDAGVTAGKKVVINMSLGCVDSGRGGPFGCANSTDNNGFQDLYDNFGVLSVASAGNAGTTQKSYPASYASVISVAAIDEDKAIAEFSQQNDAVELSGPGVGVLSTVPMGMGTVAEVTVNSTAYAADGMDGSPAGDVSAGIVNCGRATSECTAASGQICLIERGDVSFADKVLNCQNGGGLAAIIYNNEPGPLYGTLGDAVTTIPSVGISQADGQAILGLANATGTVKVGIGNYASYNGTSMSSPHVAGVAALVWNHFPDLSNAALRQALRDSAEDLGSTGRNNAYGYGLVQARAAYELLGGTGGGDPVNQPPTARFTYTCTELTCSFDGSSSSDPDGTITSYSWNFGDGGTAAGATTSHTYGADGSYNVTLTVTDNEGATGSTSQTVAVAANGGGDPEPGVIATATVSSLTHATRGPNTRSTAIVTVTGDGVALSGATVRGCFTGSINACGTGTTDSNGQVSFDSGNYRGDDAGFCVDNVTGSGIDGFTSQDACGP